MAVFLEGKILRTIVRSRYVVRHKCDMSSEDSPSESYCTIKQTVVCNNNSSIDNPPSRSLLFMKEKNQDDEHSFQQSYE